MSKQGKNRDRSQVSLAPVESKDKAVRGFSLRSAMIMLDSNFNDLTRGPLAIDSDESSAKRDPDRIFDFNQNDPLNVLQHLNEIASTASAGRTINGAKAEAALESWAQYANAIYGVTGVSMSDDEIDSMRSTVRGELMRVQIESTSPDKRHVLSIEEISPLLNFATDLPESQISHIFEPEDRVEVRSAESKDHRKERYNLRRDPREVDDDHDDT